MTHILSHSISAAELALVCCYHHRPIRLKITAIINSLTPTSSTSILSKPTGPREVLTILATERAAITGKKNGKKISGGLFFIIFLTILAANTLPRRSFPSNKQLCCSRHFYSGFPRVPTANHAPSRDIHALLYMYYTCTCTCAHFTRIIMAHVHFCHRNYPSK